MQSRFRDWGDVRVFLAVLREGSTLAASRHLGINQTTVSRRIHVLEHTLGVTLFDRTTRGAVPTEHANNLVASAEALERAALSFEADAAAERASSSKPIRVTAVGDKSIGNIGAIVAEFVEENPGVSFEFIFSEHPLDLMKGEADVALRMAAEISDDRLIARKVGVTHWTYYASRAYAAKKSLPAEFSDDMEDHRVHLLHHFSSKRRNIVRCATVNDMMMAIETGQGIGPFPVTVGDANPNLVRCFDPPSGADLQVWLLASPSALERPEVRRFTAFAGPRIARNLKHMG
ncbi:LysR family transcriptional regulator [Rhodobacterales bacterium HKCCSP123]|nr:LysR family transcriptional regulator [Rhodobacterales bacterium HKCCSP123]